jgi:hypothetical protein
MTYGPKNTKWYYIAKNTDDDENIHYGVVDAGAIVESTRELFFEYNNKSEYEAQLNHYGLESLDQIMAKMKNP